jgi:hypothetical protein
MIESGMIIPPENYACTLDGGRFTTSRFKMIYRYSNYAFNRFERLMEIKAPKLS